MYRSGLLVVSDKLRLSALRIALQQAAKRVRQTLYVHCEHKLQKENDNFVRGYYRALVKNIYASVSQISSELDVRVLLPTHAERKLTEDIEVSLYVADGSRGLSAADLRSSLINQYAFRDNDLYAHEVLDLSSLIENDDVSFLQEDTEEDTYSGVVLGGTFDRLHNGHKVLLSTASLYCREDLYVGVTDGPMVEKKTLVELMQSTGKRIANVERYLRDIQPGLNYHVVPITDPFGPSTSVQELQCIVVSQETLKGGHAVNDERKKKSYDPIVIKTVELVSDKNNDSDWMRDVKISSTTSRQRLLGTLLQSKQPMRLNSPWTKKIKTDLLSRASASCTRMPYLIGLPGGIASGKSSIASRLHKLGAAVIDCDKLGHKAYLPGSKSYYQIIKEFGKEIVNEDGLINRKALSARVFKNSDLLQTLNYIVWPAVAELVQEEIKAVAEKAIEICFIEAALLLEASWNDYFNEIWIPIIPENEALIRLMDRNNLSKEESSRRIRAQMTNNERIKHADVVLTTLWQPDVTQKQVEFAWKQLNSRIELYQQISASMDLPLTEKVVHSFQSTYASEKLDALIHLDISPFQSRLRTLLNLCDRFSYWLKEPGIVKLSVILSQCWSDREENSKVLGAMSIENKLLESVKSLLLLQENLRKSVYCNTGRTSLDEDFLIDFYRINAIFGSTAYLDGADVIDHDKRLKSWKHREIIQQEPMFRTRLCQELYEGTLSETF